MSFAAGFAGQAFQFDGVDDEIGFTSAVGHFGYQAIVLIVLLEPLAILAH